MKRFLDTVQLLLVLASTTAVVDATLAVPTEPAGYHSTEGGRGEPPRDRRFGDLARLDRRSREDRQRALGRSRTADPLELFARVD